MVSDILVEKIGLPLLKHTEQTSHGSIRVNVGKQVMVPNRISKYEE